MSNFKLTPHEREQIISILTSNSLNFMDGEYDHAVDRIEDVINQGWETCPETVDTPDAGAKFTAPV